MTRRIDAEHEDNTKASAARDARARRRPFHRRPRRRTSATSNYTVASTSTKPGEEKGKGEIKRLDCRLLHQPHGGGSC